MDGPPADTGLIMAETNSMSHGTDDASSNDQRKKVLLRREKDFFWQDLPSDRSANEKLSSVFGRRNKSAFGIRRYS
jgi:hypothetical protein